MNEIINQIITNEKKETLNYYGVNAYVYKDIDKYLDKLDNIYDKIFLSQWCHNIPKTKELIKDLSLNSYEKEKYLKLKKNNINLDETLNFKLLDHKYSFLDDYLDMLITDINIQKQIISLSDERLKIFKELYLKLNSLTDYIIPYLTVILQRISYNNHFYNDLFKDIDNLIRHNYKLSDKELDILLFLCTSSVNYNIKSFYEMKNFNKEFTVNYNEYQEMINNAIKNKDKNLLKFIILSKVYGISLEYARRIIRRYDITNIKENNDVIEMYKEINTILNIDNFDLLYEVYENINNYHKDYDKIITFENDLREIFAHILNKKVLQINNLPYEIKDNVKIYEAPLDFKMIVIALGAYKGNFQNPEDYFKYWNRPRMRSHGMSTSLISNSNLSIADVKNVILGFSNINDNMFLISSNRDLNSTKDSFNFNLVGTPLYEFQGNTRAFFTDPDNLINNTRSDYNELVFERKDLSKNPKYYKKNPDYIVYFEEYIDFNKTYEKYKNDENITNYLKYQKINQDKYLRESIRASKDFDIPIIKINREKIAINESNKIKEMLKNLKESLDPNLIEKIITTFENNRYGNFGEHKLILNTYFSEEKINNIIDSIKEIINNIDDPNIQEKLYNKLNETISKEKIKNEKCKYMQHRGQNLGIKNKAKKVKG